VCLLAFDISYFFSETSGPIAFKPGEDVACVVVCEKLLCENFYVEKNRNVIEHKQYLNDHWIVCYKV
jgi:hypothetical protein